MANSITRVRSLWNMGPSVRAELTSLKNGLSRAFWLWRACEHRQLTLWHCVEYWAEQRPRARALSDESESINWSTLREQTQMLASVLRDSGVKDGTRVALIADNSVKLIVSLFAIQLAGGVPIPLDSWASSEWLRETLGELEPGLALIESSKDAEHLGSLKSCRTLTMRELWQRTSKPNAYPHRGRSGQRPFAILVTSGTTGKPKSVVISNTRCVLSGYGIAGFCLALTEKDVLFCALPLSHATALMTGLCASMVSGCAFVMRRRWVSDEFWRDVAAEKATCLLYVGELVRRLLSAPQRPEENAHRLRVAYGNGMALDVWHRFQARFGIREILEFYGATELPLAMVNLAQRPGYIGHSLWSTLSPWRVVVRDAETGELVRNSAGKCIDCEPEQPGELVLLTRPFGNFRFSDSLAPSTDHEHMQRVSDVAHPGDEGLRTGDIVVRDREGYVKFEDRTFEVFRQQGRNVSVAQLVRALRAFEGVAAIGVTHLTLRHYDGQLGLAVLVPSSAFSLDGLKEFYQSIPRYARPRFLRLTNALRVNRGLKFDHAFYRAEGLDPERSTQERIFVYSNGAFEPISVEILAKLSLGRFRF